MEQHQIILAIIAILAWSGFLLGHSHFSKYVSDPSSTAMFDQNDRSRRLFSSAVSSFLDPKSITLRTGGGLVVPKFDVQEEAQLDALKYAEPSLVHHRPDLDNQGVVVDVLSIGSETRPEYLAAQVETWASHINVRHYWGVTEREDYDINCPSMSDEYLQSFLHTCKSPMGWDNDIEQFRTRHFGAASGFKRQQAGWFCAQRRPGRALGWLQAMYQNETKIPDILILVDDDTSLDVNKMKQLMLREEYNDHPFAGAMCTFEQGGFVFPFGGFGTFLNRAAIQSMTRPIVCDEQQRGNKFMESICANLRQNRVGELDVFANGDSIFELFYKYSALDNFCMHSDWAIGYMITFYSGGSLHGLNPRQCRTTGCTGRSVTCHNQTPKDMKDFTLAHS
mmetsp:Transcript_2526/g.5372  ORF Transcript_2526/g.5372 Transcript_2526/m.5372 type:complete len:393 (-) Transcript_2526:467-1645(-)|eukprot:CAMPEP_0172302586 /NCGR_PEP_ID=MMETSP1058-20130122/4262_1 /TAXON_ID=83371 /ORGANISM="Detonula confervacea, Strain CCMP 353" /LENGTH=392 /DNA_ID=CAMNT_0013013115 /DNA_START=88 /DNA_END=1266 /DNA_ORIENTATION=+